MCTNVPGLGAGKCDSGKVPRVNCSDGLDLCMSLKGKMTVLGFTQSIELKNCSNNVLCDSASDYNACKLLNQTGYLTSCSLNCTTPDTTPDALPATGGVKKLGPRAFFGAMFLLALIPSVF
ncbi:unnamed protein product [Porites lobata]|uniref:Uncharacterized protein n=1 Tax=Porites lobata TaxID=104759 RepID=A0ABN8Q7K9_9CNID|nr:unnamed protein product [Porites lobata]